MSGPRRKSSVKINPEGAWVERRAIGFGITQYTAFCRAYCRAYPMPIGFVWGVEFGGKRPVLHVWDSYVVPWARRSGVRTLINREIFRNNAAIICGARSKQGMAFMKARGYLYDARLDEWSLTRPKKAGRSAA